MINYREAKTFMKTPSEQGCQKSELVDFEGTFGGYLYNYSFVRHVQMVASAC